MKELEKLHKIEECVLGIYDSIEWLREYSQEPSNYYRPDRIDQYNHVHARVGHYRNVFYGLYGEFSNAENRMQRIEKNENE